MDGIDGFKRIFVFLTVQAAYLVACAAYLGFLTVLHWSNTDFAITMMPAFLNAAIGLLLLRAAWPMGTSGVELFWGTSVKIHVERLMEPALLAGMIALLVAAIIANFSGDFTLIAALDMALMVAAIGGPLLVSLLLMISAVRRLIAYRRSLELMKTQRFSFSRLQRVDVSIASESGLSATTVRPSPQGFTFAGLTSKPWHDPADFPWVAAFEEAVDEITAEFEKVSRLEQERINTYKYAGLEGDFWKSFQLVTRHREIPENTALCPVTTRLLKTIPHYPWFRDAMFSILDGGGVIQPHRDVSNVFLTMHLPLIAPGNGFMEVAGMTQEWRRGKAMIFDSSYHHQAQNNSGERRVVLLVDFLHPDLTEDEAAWVSASRL
jgi:beta-hydroxylase